MGLLISLLRLLHPIPAVKRTIKRAIVPRPIRRASWIAGGIAHPVSRAKYSVNRSVIRKVDKATTPRPKHRRPTRRRLPANNVDELGAKGVPTDYDDVTRFVAHRADVPLERLREFNRLVASGEKSTAARLFTNDEGHRIAAAFQEATRQLRSIRRKLPKRP